MKFPVQKLKPILVCLSLSIFSMIITKAQTGSNKPVRVAVAGITHGHVPWILKKRDKKDIELVGIYEPNQELSQRYAKTYGLNLSIFYTNLGSMLDAVKPEAVVAFGSVNEHLAAVEACAPRGIHVMVEKPLATTKEQAAKMRQLATDHPIHLLTNFETSWYPATEKTYQLVKDSNFVGKLNKVVFHHGHQGPKKINVNKEFFEWLTDPIQNGGGALIDFGCYGANIMTYLMQGVEPLSVTAVTHHLQPDIYPKVDDEATIIVTYPAAQCIIQASWNWPFSRKDMEVYGEQGYVITTDNTKMRVRNNQSAGEQPLTVTTKEVPVYTDPFSYFADVIRGKITVPTNSLYSLENNVMVVRILDAARESAKTGKTVLLNK